MTETNSSTLNSVGLRLYKCLIKLLFSSCVLLSLEDMTAAGDSLVLLAGTTLFSSAGFGALEVRSACLACELICFITMLRVM